MSNERHETVTDNVSANHQFRETAKMVHHEEVAVAEMETTTPTSEKSSVVGNAAAMREALEALVGVIDECNSGNPLWWHIGAKGMKPLKDARAALSAPPRNCDVGTPEEQSSRFDSHCRKHMGCLTCPLREKDGGVQNHCEFAWAQMPYDEGGAK